MMESSEKTYTDHRRGDGNDVTNKRAASEAAMHTGDFDFDDTCSASNAAAPTTRKRRAVSTTNVKNASDYLTPELFGILSSYLPKVGFVKLVNALNGANDRKSAYYKAAIIEIHRSNPKFSETCLLENAYDKLPGKNNNPSHHCPSCDGYYESPDERVKLYKQSGNKVRHWIQVNPNLWKQRIAVSSLDNAVAFAASCDSSEKYAPFRSMTVEQKVADKLYIHHEVGADECRYEVARSSDKAFQEVYGMCLIAVNGEPVHSLEVPSGNEWEAFQQIESGFRSIQDYLYRSNDRDWHGNFLPGKGGPLNLLFMSKGDVFFNEIFAVVRCDLVEILKEMYEKGLVSATTRVYETKYPLLWYVYFNAPGKFCFNFLLSQKDVDCNIRSQQNSAQPIGATLLIEASNIDEFPSGIDAYDALVNHPKTNVNAQVQKSSYGSYFFSKGDTALHAVVSQLKYRYHCGDTLVHMTKVLIGAGADPNMKSEAKGTVIDYFHKMRSESQTCKYGKPKTFEKHLDEIESLLMRRSPKPSQTISKKVAIDPKIKAIFDKWSKEAKTRGCNRIVVQKDAAKKLILHALIDMACPVTFTKLYEEMKAAVPPPILRCCLDEMSTGESDASDEYAGTVRVDQGMRSITTKDALYSVVNKTVSKKLIFDTLREYACPVNIDELHQKMEGAGWFVPLRLLREYLDEMIDKSKSIGVENESIAKHISCRYSGSVYVEEGSDSGNTFFYVNSTPAVLSEDIDAVEENDEFDDVDTFEEDDEFEGLDNFNNDEFEDVHDLCLLEQSTTETRKDTEVTQRNIGNQGFKSAKKLEEEISAMKIERQKCKEFLDATDFVDKFDLGGQF